MIQPGRLDLAADRWVACIRTLPIVNADLTGAAFSLQVRLAPDTPGSALISLGNAASAAAEGVRVVEAATVTVASHIAAGRLNEVPNGYALIDSVAVTVLGLRINESTMEGLPPAAETGMDLDCAWDLHITPSGSIKDKYAGGKFTIRAGVTQ